ncbi:MAG: ABC transporter substrate-binding protein [Fibrobacterota bacterium]
MLKSFFIVLFSVFCVSGAGILFAYSNENHGGWDEKIYKKLRSYYQSRFSTDVYFVDIGSADDSREISIFIESLRAKRPELLVISGEELLKESCYELKKMKSVPVLFCGVSDFLESGLPSGNISGVGMAEPFASAIDAAERTMPPIKQICVVGDKSHFVASQEIEMICEDKGYKCDSFFPEPRFEKIRKILTDNVSERTVFIMLGLKKIIDEHNNIVADSKIAKAIEENGVRVVAIDKTWASRGALCGALPEAVHHAELICEMGDEIFHGRPVADLSVLVPKKGRKFINKKKADNFRLKVPDILLKDFQIIR